ncbi:MAG: Uma2 family endonuclease [Pyrinomonadaceae bacterium]|jgi:Uma2 family endonuclease|nr:Uma2 family endonuclease [Pyrinomonadaceae bacterium]
MSSITEKPDAQILPSGERAPLRMTFEEFLAWNSEATMAEWVDGEVIVMSPVSTRHQIISGFLFTILNLFVEKHGLGIMLSAPVVIRLPNKRRGREPDLFFVAKDRAQLIKKNYLDGAADIVVEIISPESIERDRVEKFAEYEAAGVREYWLIDPDREQAEFYVLAAENRYRLQDAPEGVYHSRVIEGFSLRVAWLWQEQLPTFEALRELKIF